MTQNKKPVKTLSKNEPMRINRYLSIRGIATRKGADELIKKGVVLLNGKKAVLGDKIGPKDKVSIAGVIDTGNYHYFVYCKPKGVTTLPEKNTLSVMTMANSLPKDAFPVGRLDKDSEGLLIITNDGRITKKLLDGKYNHEKEYIVEVSHPIEHNFMVRLRDGVRLGKEMTKKAKVRKIDKYTFEIIITEGKNRQIRRMCASFNQEVRELKRVRIMNIELGNLHPNTYREIKGKDLEDFLKKVL